jgi:pre-mRNA-processing factor SLU7
MASAGGKMLSAEERRRQKELEEARKAGLAAPEVDEEGNAINPHIPQFMASAPWYLNNDHPSLKHQRNWKGGPQGDDKGWYDRGAKVFQATKYRKGACENCGSMSHKTKDCMERPRSKGAKFTNKNIAADEKVQDVNLISFDAKRDRWNGYSADEWTKQAENFDKMAEMRAEVRRKELLEQKFNGNSGEDDNDDNEDNDAAAAVGEEDKIEDDGVEEDKVVEEEESGFAKIEKRVRASGAATGTVRNLRIREDTAKYLLNLDVESAHYDPKSRSMREDPNPEKDPSEKTFAGDNFIRQTGGASDGFKTLNLFSVTAYEKGQDTHLQATPSQAEAAFKAFQMKKATLQGQTKSELLDKYGSAAEAPSEEMLALRGTEAYVEYDAAGRVIRGQEVKARSRYEEDVYPGNHTSVWGSWWKEGIWGYACCHSTIKGSYCTGAAGQGAAEDTATALQKNMLAYAEKKAKEAAAEAEDDSDDSSREEEKKKSKKKLEGVKPGNAAGVWGSEADKEDIQIDPKKLKEALKRAEAAAKAAEDELEGGGDDRKRRFNSLNEDCNVSAEDMEAYRMKKSRGDDPLAAIEAAKAAQKKKDGGGGGGGNDYDFV